MEAYLTPGELREELAGIHDQLADLPADAFGERSRLRRRQHELRAASRRYAAQSVPTHELEARAQQLRRRLDDLFDNRRMNPGGAGVGGEGGGGIEPVSLQRINAAIDSGYGRAAIQEELRAVAAELRRRTEGERNLAAAHSSAKTTAADASEAG